MTSRSRSLILLLTLGCGCTLSWAAADKPATPEERKKEDAAEIDRQMQGLSFLGVFDADEVVSFSMHDGKLTPATALPITQEFGAIKIRQLPGRARVRVVNGRNDSGDNVGKFFQFGYYDLAVPGTIEVHAEVLFGPDLVHVAQDVDYPDGMTQTVQLVQAAANGPTSVKLYVQNLPDSDDGKFSEFSRAGSSVTDLCLKYPTEANQYLRPMFRRLGQESVLFAVDPRAAWQVLADEWTADAPTIAAINADVARLGVDSFEERERAAADLRKLGQPAAVYLMKSPRDALTLEQQMRVDLFLVPYQPLAPKDVRRLGGDRSFLIDCLYDNDAALRRLVLKRLESVTGQPIDFDPAVSDPLTNAAVARLRDQLDPAPVTRPGAARFAGHTMNSSKSQIRKVFLTGMFATIPIVVTIMLVLWINDQTQPITRWLFGRTIPFLGVVIALWAIYLIGMIANSIIGKYLLRLVDHLLARVPVIRPFYVGWKQIALTPGGSEGIYSKVVLIPDDTGQMKWLGFTSGRVVEGEEAMYCVFVPSAPNPINGRIYFVPLDKCTLLEMSPEEAFKLILSTGNYVPPLTPAQLEAEPAQRCR